MRFLKGFGCILAILLVIVVLMAVVPLPPVKFTPSAPCKTFEEATARFAEILAATPLDVREICQPFMLTHGKKTARAFVLMHGLTNCPEEYRRLARELHEKGYNVIVPLTPYQGKTNVLTNALAKLTAKDMLQSADAAISVARGLGDKVTLVGLSVNGVTAGWYAQNTRLADRVMLISPFYGIKGYPAFSTPYVAAFFMRIPNYFFWWNPKLKQNNPEAPYTYPRAPTHPIADILLLGQEVIKEAESAPPETKDIVVVTSLDDQTINPARVDQLVAAWRKSSANVTVYRFPASDKVPHEMIDPHHIAQQVDTVYPVILKFLTE